MTEYDDEYMVIDGHSVKRSAVIDGRPDLDGPSGRNFGKTRAKRHPPYVFSIRANAALVHKVLYVELHWYYPAGYAGRYLIKLQRPEMFAVTTCGAHFFLKPDRSRTCRVPSPDAVLCGKCHGEGANFPGRDRSRWTTVKREAHVKLGCVVDGY